MMLNQKTNRVAAKLAMWVAFCATVWCVGASEANAAAANMKVTVRKFSGDVQTAVGPKWVKATVGMKLVSGARIKTGANGEAILTWDNGNVVKLRPLSNLVLQAVTKAGDTTNVALDVKKGNIFAKVKKLQTANSSFVVGTPTAVAGVRGTALEGGEDGYAVAEGNIAAAPRTEDMDLGDTDAVNANLDENGIDLGAGMELTVTETGEFTEPAPMPPIRLNQLNTENQETEAIAAEGGDDLSTNGEGEKEEGTKEGGAKEEGGKEGGAKEEGAKEGEEEGAAEEEGGGEEAGAEESGVEEAEGPEGVEGPEEIGETEFEVDTDTIDNTVDTVDSVVNDIVEGAEDAQELFDEFTGALEIIIE